MTMTNQQSRDLARLKELLAQYPEPWKIEKKPHNYNDGTKEFTHVRYVKDHLADEPINISIGEYLTPDLAELLILLRDLTPTLASECERLRAENERLREALKPFADFAEKAEQFVDARAKDGGSPLMPTRDFRLSDFKRARAALSTSESSK